VITQELIKSVAPRARDDYVAALVGGDAVLQQYEIITPLRLAAFMATISHEAGSLTIVRENMNYTAARIKQVWPTRPQAVKFAGKPRELANCVYNGRMGNAVGSDDGWNFRGGGLIQLTGRDSYRRAGLAIGVNLESQPGLIEEAEVSLKAACWEFSKFAALCDKGDKGFRGVCNGINRGNALSTLDPIGWADRQVWYARWCRALGVNAVAEDDVLNFGDQGALVEACQKRLTMLGYANGKPDGIFGSLTRSAVLTFQAENGLTVDGDIGPQTRAVLNSETAKPLPLGDRSLATVADLRAAGSTTIVATDKIKNVGAVVVAASAVTGGVQETGILTVATDTLKELTLLRTTTVGFVDVFSWALSHWYLFAVVGGFFVWKWARDVQWRRLIEHNTGLNLSR
jgi:putative chitinase